MRRPFDNKSRPSFVLVALVLSASVACSDDPLQPIARAPEAPAPVDPPAVPAPVPPVVPPATPVTPKGPGSIQGRICAGTSFWLSGALVEVSLDDGSQVITSTDANGFFRLTGVPAGHYVVEVRRGSFSTSFAVDVVAELTSEVGNQCIDPTTRIAVVTGVYDDVETVLDRLGFPMRRRFDVTGVTEVDPQGNVDLIAGRPTSDYYADWPTDAASKFWVREFLADPVWLAEYDIVFLNCGVNDADIEAGGPLFAAAKDNLRAFVAAGGSLYASDWASELLRLSFPDRLRFLGNDATFGASRMGVPNLLQASRVPDAGLAQSLGAANATISLDLDWWVVLEPTSAQRADVHVLVEADVQYYLDFGRSERANQSRAPIIAHFDEGEGRVLFTSAHLDFQTTADLEHILFYTVFEL